MIFVHIEKEFSEAVMQRLDTIKRFLPTRKLNRTYENTEISTGRSTQS